MAGGLAALGIGRGDRVAFLDKNNPACLEVALGAGLLGHVDHGGYLFVSDRSRT